MRVLLSLSVFDSAYKRNKGSVPDARTSTHCSFLSVNLRPSVVDNAWSVLNVSFNFCASGFFKKVTIASFLEGSMVMLSSQNLKSPYLDKIFFLSLDKGIFVVVIMPNNNKPGRNPHFSKVCWDIENPPDDSTARTRAFSVFPLSKKGVKYLKPTAVSSQVTLFFLHQDFTS